VPDRDVLSCVPWRQRCACRAHVAARPLMRRRRRMVSEAAEATKLTQGSGTTRARPTSSLAPGLADPTYVIITSSRPPEEVFGSSPQETSAYYILLHGTYGQDGRAPAHGRAGGRAGASQGSKGPVAGAPRAKRPS